MMVYFIPLHLLVFFFVVKREGLKGLEGKIGMEKVLEGG